jgi:hypothetical protein
MSAPIRKRPGEAFGSLRVIRVASAHPPHPQATKRMTEAELIASFGPNRLPGLEEKQSTDIK